MTTLYFASETPDPDAIKRVSWVPDKILHLYYQNSIEDKYELHFIFQTVTFSSLLHDMYNTIYMYSL